MTDTKSVIDFSCPLHRSLIKRDLILGVSRSSLILVIVFLYFGVFEIGKSTIVRLIFLFAGILLFYIIRKLTKTDEYLVEIVIHSLLSPDRLEP